MPGVGGAGVVGRHLPVLVADFRMEAEAPRGLEVRVCGPGSAYRRYSWRGGVLCGKRMGMAHVTAHCKCQPSRYAGCCQEVLICHFLRRGMLASVGSVIGVERGLPSSPMSRMVQDCSMQVFIGIYVAWHHRCCGDGSLK